MSNAIADAASAMMLVEQCKDKLNECKVRLLATFSHVPDDKLDWCPSPSAKSAIRIVAHCAISNGFFANILRGEPMPEGDMGEMMEQMDQMERAVATRGAAVKMIDETTEAVVNALDNMTPEMIASVVPTPFLTAPMPFFMDLPARHFDNHASQIDYLQTCWGDQENHFG